jgi:hypothetical protein
MGKYFTFNELINSDTARKYNIDNYPKEDASINNINISCEKLDIIREEWAKYCQSHKLGNPALIINSGYRCEKLNRAVNGSKTSEHMLGTAYDIDTANGKNKIFIEWLYGYLNKNEILVSQIINEKPNANGEPSWIHLGLEGRHPNRYRCQYFTIK